MFKKLLHPPKRNENKSLLVPNNDAIRKYDPKFPKPDPEDLLKENILIKR